MTFGTLFMYIIGPFITYYEIVYVGVAYLALFTVSFFFMPESPTYHLLKSEFYIFILLIFVKSSNPKERFTRAVVKIYFGKSFSPLLFHFCPWNFKKNIPVLSTPLTKAKHVFQMTEKQPLILWWDFEAVLSRVYRRSWIKSTLMSKLLKTTNQERFVLN